MKTFFMKSGQKAAACLLFLLLFILLFSCGNESDENNFSEPVETASASFSIAWHETSDLLGMDTTVLSARGKKSVVFAQGENEWGLAQTEAVNCDLIDTIVCEVYDASNNDLTSATFACTTGQGTINNIPVGSGRVFVILGEAAATAVTAGGEIISRGEISDVTIEANQTNDLGTIDVYPFYVSTLLDPIEASTVAVGEVTFQWAGIENASEYNILVSSDSLFNTTILNEFTTETI